MSRGSISQGPNLIHPEKPSAVGSRNSINRSGRDEYSEAKMLIDEQVDKVLNHINSKLPPEVLERLHVSGSVKELLHNYFNQGFTNMFNRYLTTVEDEMGKKFRDLLDKEEYSTLNKYTPKEISELVDKIGGSEKFNTGELEKSVVNIYGHLQGHIQRGVFDLEQQTNNILRQKVDVGAFVRGENTYAVVKCSFRDNFVKPETVSDIKLVINVLDSELKSPIYFYQVASESIIKDVVSDHIMGLVDKEIDKINNQLMDEGQSTLTSEEEIFEKFKGLDQYVNERDSKNNDKQYTFVAEKFFESIQGIGPEIDNVDFDPMNLRENVKKIIDKENIRNRGFNTSINALTSILDNSRMGYQFIQNYKNARQLVLREYEDTNPTGLPDERYQINLGYYGDEELRRFRVAFCQQLEELTYEVEKIWDVVEKVYLAEKEREQFLDFEDVYSDFMDTGKSKSSFWGSSDDDDEDDEEEYEKEWDEIDFIEPEKTEVEKLNETFITQVRKANKKIDLLREKIVKIYKNRTPEDRIIISQRLDFIQESLDMFEAQYNPFHVQPGLVLEISLTTIKRKQTTMYSISNVLNEFLSEISKGFADSAFADYSRRRSIVRNDIDQDFEDVPVGEDQMTGSNVEGVAELE